MLEISIGLKNLDVRLEVFGPGFRLLVWGLGFRTK